MLQEQSKELKLLSASRRENSTRLLDTDSDDEVHEISSFEYDTKFSDDDYENENTEADQNAHIILDNRPVGNPNLQLYKSSNGSSDTSNTDESGTDESDTDCFTEKIKKAPKRLKKKHNLVSYPHYVKLEKLGIIQPQASKVLQRGFKDVDDIIRALKMLNVSRIRYIWQQSYMLLQKNTELRRKIKSLGRAALTKKKEEDFSIFELEELIKELSHSGPRKRARSAKRNESMTFDLVKCSKTEQSKEPLKRYYALFQESVINTQNINDAMTFHTTNKNLLSLSHVVERTEEPNFPGSD